MYIIYIIYYIYIYIYSMDNYKCLHVAMRLTFITQNVSGSIINNQQ